MQHIKGIANILADSVSRLKAVGLYHDLDIQNIQPELGSTFEPLPTMEQETQTLVIVHEIFIKPDVETLAKYFAVTQIEDPNMSMTDVSPQDADCIEQKLMFLPKLTPDKITQLQNNDTFYNNIIIHMHCNLHVKYFIDAMGILHKKVIDFNSTFSSVVIPKIPIKYLLHASHDSLGHVGAKKLYHFIKRLYNFLGM